MLKHVARTPPFACRNRQCRRLDEGTQILAGLNPLPQARLEAPELQLAQPAALRAVQATTKPGRVPKPAAFRSFLFLPIVPPNSLP
jgi:hypothetical protein